jgi:YidC/Oxa1 family membrane protein insertase
MISDWSGAAFEYALGLEKPVIFVDVPKKVNNPNYEEIPQVPLEVMLRSKIGEVVPPDRLSEIPAAVERLCKTPDFMQRYLQELRAEWVYNVGSAAEVSAGHIVQSANLGMPNTKVVQ